MTKATSISRADYAAREILSVFLKLGFVALGGPTAHIAMMYRECVQRREWLDDRQFLDLLAASYLIPGPNSTMMSMNLGYVRRRDAGLWIAGLCFIMPGVLMALALAWGYMHFSESVVVRGAFWGVQAIVIAIVIDAMAQLAPRAVTNRLTAALFVAGLVGTLMGAGALLLVVVAGAIGLARSWRPVRPSPTLAIGGFFGLGHLLPAMSDGDGMRIVQIGWVFLKVALILFDGSLFIGYVKADVVDRYGWLTNQQLLDAVALGQSTPGPVMKSSTIIGYLAAGLPGAIVATVMIFLPTFLFAMILGRWMLRARIGTLLSAVLGHMLPVVVALMVVVTAELVEDAVTHPLQLALALGTFVALRRNLLDSALLIAFGAIVGLIYML